LVVLVQLVGLPNLELSLHQAVVVLAELKIAVPLTLMHRQLFEAAVAELVVKIQGAAAQIRESVHSPAEVLRM
jgi:hypothetical protein